VPLQNTNLKEEPFTLKPNTYMNLSGKAVQYWMDKENISLENIFVIMMIEPVFRYNPHQA
jgi:peptidyl-tRNA hydrolase